LARIAAFIAAQGAVPAIQLAHALQRLRQHRAPQFVECFVGQLLQHEHVGLEAL
jgi:hypothetical protein